ncbi:MAG: type I-E CRISPR-associated protein Cas7/Cse4/CasC [Candidatus Lokiarchaeota archaeon]
MFIELHMIQNFGPSCLNRDDTNTPKDCQFGGFRRARISSQCLKRAIRNYFKDNLSEMEEYLGVRTRLLPKKVLEKLLENGKDENEATEITKKILKKFKFKLDGDSTTQTDVLLFLNNDTHKKIAKFILENWNDLKGKVNNSTVKPLIDELENDLDVDIALFGRMVASNTDLNVDSACYMAHAISTHKVDMEMDFYTALDDLQEETESGAGMMGIIMYNSSCFYRYSVLDFNQLLSNLSKNHDLTTSVIEGFLKASINAIPTGKQTSMASFNKPDFIMITIRSDQPWSLTNAFSNPVKVGYKDTDLIEQSINKLDEYFNDINTLYNTIEDLDVHYCITGNKELKYIGQKGKKYVSIDKMIKKIGESINERYSSSP